MVVIESISTTNRSRGGCLDHLVPHVMAMRRWFGFPLFIGGRDGYPA
jgi:hypothetical protein